MASETHATTSGATFQRGNFFENDDDTKSILSNAFSELRAIIFDVRASSAILLAAYDATTNEASRLSRACKDDRAQRTRTRQTMMTEAQKLAIRLERESDDGTKQLVLMNQMLQETHVQLMEENDSCHRLLEHALSPTSLQRNMQIRSIQDGTSHVMNEMSKVESVLLRATSEFTRAVKSFNSSGGGGVQRVGSGDVGRNATSMLDTEYFEGQPIRASLEELKQLRSEVVRLRHTLSSTAMPKQRGSSSSSNSNGGGRDNGGSGEEYDRRVAYDKQYKKETADAQVIRDLKKRVEELLARQGPEGGDATNMSPVPNVFTESHAATQQQLRQLLRREKEQVRVFNFFLI